MWLCWEACEREEREEEARKGAGKLAACGVCRRRKEGNGIPMLMTRWDW